jgi:hypothetical protein
MMIIKQVKRSLMSMNLLVILAAFYFDVIASQVETFQEIPVKIFNGNQEELLDGSSEYSDCISAFGQAMRRQKIIVPGDVAEIYLSILPATGTLSRKLLISYLFPVESRKENKYITIDY